MFRCKLAPEPPKWLHYSKIMINMRPKVLCKTLKQWSGRMVVCHVPWVKMIPNADHTHFQIFSSKTPKLICDAQMSSKLLPFWTMLCIMHIALLFLSMTVCDMYATLLQVTLNFGSILYILYCVYTVWDVLHI